jgi:cellulose synthase/poly-beta-1,6-N-acetylglucosamine synthase-like glycosyltransferase
MGPAPPTSFLRWLAPVVAVVAVTLAIPAAMTLYPAVLERHLPWIRLVALTFIIGWHVIRPFVVYVLDRLRRDVPAPPPVGVSIIVPCHNVASQLRQLVLNLLDQTHRPLEIVLVENGSSDNTRDQARALASEFDEVRVFSVSPAPTDYAAGVAANHGVAHASYPIILKMDDDTCLRHDAVARALAHLLHDDAVAVACDLRVANPDATLWTRFQSLEYLLAMDLDRRIQASVDSVICCSGGMSVFRREAVVKAGGFVSAPRMVSEDMDMTFRSHQQGRVSMAPESIGFTKVPESLGNLARQRVRWAISGMVALYLHRAGVMNPRYWGKRWIAMFGVPLRVAIASRDLVAPVLILDVYLLWRNEGIAWFVAMFAFHTLMRLLQLLLLAPALNRYESKQGLSSFWLVPFFSLLYGPMILLARFIGSWRSVAHVLELRNRDDVVERSGLLIRIPVLEDQATEVIPIPEIAFSTSDLITDRVDH